MRTINRGTRASAALVCAIAAVGTLSASASAPAASKVIGPRAKVVAKHRDPRGDRRAHDR